MYILTLGMVKALVLLLRGDPGAARRLVCRAHKRTPDESPLGARYCWLLVAGAIRAVDGDVEGAVDLLARLLAEPLPPTIPEVMLMHPHAIRAALHVGDPNLADRLVAVVEAVRPLNDHVIATGRALLAESAGELERAAEEFADAAARWHDFGVPYEEAQALLGPGALPGSTRQRRRRRQRPSPPPARSSRGSAPSRRSRRRGPLWPRLASRAPSERAAREPSARRVRERRRSGSALHAAAPA